MELIAGLRELYITTVNLHADKTAEYFMVMSTPTRSMAQPGSQTEYSEPLPRATQDVHLASTKIRTSSQLIKISKNNT